MTTGRIIAAKSLPHFIPGRKNDQPVDVWYTIHVTFKI